MDYIDFIDAPAVRDHLRTLPPLPPAQQCILIAQSDIQPLTKKLAALKAIRDATPPEDFSRGCWHFRCDDPFPVILDRYIRTREELLARFLEAEPGIIYIAEDADGWCAAPFSTLDAALTTVHKMSWRNGSPSVIRRRIDEPRGEILDATITRNWEIAEIFAKRYHDDEWARSLGGDMPNGYAHVPHPFKRGDIVRQFGDTYCVLAENVEDAGAILPKNPDWCDMLLHGVTWDKQTGTFDHDRSILFTQYGTEFVVPTDLPEEQRMLAAVSLVLRGKYSLADFLELLTTGRMNTLGEVAMNLSEEDADDA